MSSNYESTFSNWLQEEKYAVSLLNSVGELMYDKGIELVFFRNHIVDVNIPSLMSYFNYAKDVIGEKVSVKDVNNMAMAISEIDFAPAKLDVGLLTSEFNSSNETDMNTFLSNKLSDFIGQEKHTFKPKDVILYGFGRIGRLAARELVKQAGKGQQLRLKAIVTRNPSDDQIIKRAALLRNDSVHGAFNGIVDVDLENKAIVINGQSVKMIAGSNPEDIDYTKYGINDALLIDNTGAFTDKESLSLHMQSKGVSKVLLTAPGKEIPNIVYGINNHDLDIDGLDIFSAASCTTNAISPILKIVEDNYGVEKGHIETIHAYTNDQNLLDNMHKKPRRGRSAAINMVITSTGAGKAVTKVIPSLLDKLTANAVRVPTPNGSLAIIKLSLNKSTSVEDINSFIRNAALSGKLVNQINYQIDPELVSNDIIGNTCCSVFDSSATIVSKTGEDVVLYTWYDNEFGYTKQVIRLAKQIAKVRRLTYY
ncbi:MAG: glyceraldehyde-3-phosphate dehydrogenase [Flavobacteriales bacterium]|jgi:glyceraldehyde 3-phosphate dehydrogenase|nr:glyceraldehyde-3-phosphate dehydrogenase [Flavobacteriales bacterium]MBT6013984.1 glyceraldehyde-3-phosphate dehydrogenase [Flavobacteriales bacterium]MBT7481302.1 glyceraldehyde-3-phosphate dehydrogenase [Flavobacteriales bacterium]